MEQAATATMATTGGPGRRLLQQFHAHAPFLIFGLGMLAASEAVKVMLGGTAATDPAGRLLGFALFSMVLIPGLLPMLFFRIAVFDRANRPARALLASFRPFLTSGGRLLPGLLAIASIYVFSTSFGYFKAVIPVFQPFSWDQTFDAWDTWLHFGYRPWELLDHVLGYGPVTALININYNFWFITLIMYWLHFAFEERPGVLRTQAIISYMLTWLAGGVLLAMVFSSAGPCFYGKLGLGPDPYAGLMSYLQTTSQTWPVWAVGLQDWLWTNYTSDAAADLTKGISAMPSMHNAQSALLVLATWRKLPLIRNLAIAHGVLVFLGSIHLGWHYAVDAYLAFAIAGVAWITAGVFARAWEARRTPRSLAPEV